MDENPKYKIRVDTRNYDSYSYSNALTLNPGETCQTVWL